jgi:hypothetical protein
VLWAAVGRLRQKVAVIGGFEWAQLADADLYQIITAQR